MAPDAQLKSLLDAQRAAFLAAGVVPAAVRRDRLTRAIDLLVTHETRLCEAVAQDFGRRPASLTRFLDIFSAVHALKFARKNIERWMKPLARPLGFPNLAPGTSAKIEYQPLGVVGVISPWNFPVTLTFGPLAGILAAGNRCMIKPSELTPATSELLRELVGRAFDPVEVVVVTGGQELAESFSRLPFDHIVFTGSTQVGRRVMAAAAENLVPVTLELGGKCPVIIGRSANLTRAVDRIMLGKMANAGQICLAPDYVCVPRESVNAFVDGARRWTQRAYPNLPSNPDYTSLVSARHFDRAEALLKMSGRTGRTSSTCRNPGASIPRCLLPHSCCGLHVTCASCVKRYSLRCCLSLPTTSWIPSLQTSDAASLPWRSIISAPIGRRSAKVLDRTLSGGVTVNDIAMHFLAEELPFGGVGASGLGAYHGEYGFRRFSHARAVFRQSRFDTAGLIGLRPPYAPRLRRCLNWLIRR